MLPDECTESIMYGTHIQKKTPSAFNLDAFESVYMLNANGNTKTTERSLFFPTPSLSIP